MTNKRALGMLGLAARAGKLASGAFQVEKALESGAAKLVLMDESASKQTAETYTALCANKNVPLEVLSEDELGQAIGKPGRVVAAVTDDSFSRKICELIHGGV